MEILVELSQSWFSGVYDLCTVSPLSIFFFLPASVGHKMLCKADTVFE